MRKYVISFHGDNDRLHGEALAAAVDAAEKVNHGPVYRAWIERPKGGREGAIPDGWEVLPDDNERTS